MENWRKISIAPVLSQGARNQQQQSNNTLSSSSDSSTSSSIPKQIKFTLTDNDFYSYLLGSWKRNLEWKEFGGLFQHIRTSNTVVLIEEVTKFDSDPGSRNLKWSFGKSLNKNELHFGYTMKFITAPKSIETYLEWTYIGTPCHGKFFNFNNVAVLNFFQPHSTVIVTYRIVDQDTMSVCVVEVDEKQTPSIQYGNMYRIDSTLYMK